MANDWILDVLADLRTFARENNLPQLAEGLGEASRIAAAELASRQGTGPEAVPGDAGHVGYDYCASGTSDDTG